MILFISFFLYISITFSLLPSFLKVEKAVFFYTATCWNHGSSSPFLNMNIHVCHLLSCLLFYKIKIELEFSVIYVFSPRIFETIPTFLFSRICLSYVPHPHPPTLRIISAMHHCCIFPYAYVFSLNLSLQIPHSLERSLECQSSQTVFQTMDVTLFWGISTTN